MSKRYSEHHLKFATYCITKSKAILTIPTKEFIDYGQAALKAQQLANELQMPVKLMFKNDDITKIKPQ